MTFSAIYDHRVYFKNVNRKETFDWSIQLIRFDGGSQRQFMWLLDFDSGKNLSIIEVFRNGCMFKTWGMV